MAIDHKGRTVRPERLRGNIATPSINGQRRGVDTNRVLGGITAKKLARVLRDAEGGHLYDLLTLAMEIERRDLHYASVLSTRKLAIWSLPARVDAVSDSPLDVDVAEFIDQNVLRKPWFRHMLRDNLDALAKGFSVCELKWEFTENSWLPVGYEYIDPRWFKLRDGREIRLRDAAASVEGLELEPGKFITHRARLRSGLTLYDGLMWPISVYFLFKNFGVRDWLQYSEVFGMPVRVGRHHATATENDIDTLATAVEKIGSDAGAVIPEGMDLELLGVAGGQGTDLFRGLVDWVDSQVSKAVLGQTMTTDDGASLAQAKVHEGVRQDILAADAQNLSDTLQEQLIDLVVQLNYGDIEIPDLFIGLEDSEDLELLSKSLPPFIDRGLAVESSVIRDKFGLPEPEEGSETLGQAGTVDPDPGQQQQQQQTRQLNALEPVFEDAMEVAAAEADEWRKVMDPVDKAIRAAVRESTSMAELPALLAKHLDGLDFTELQKRTALLDFLARGIGDATDSLS